MNGLYKVKTRERKGCLQTVRIAFRTPKKGKMVAFVREWVRLWMDTCHDERQPLAKPLEQQYTIGKISA